MIFTFEGICLSLVYLKETVHEYKKDALPKSSSSFECQQKDKLVMLNLERPVTSNGGFKCGFNTAQCFPCLLITVSPPQALCKCSLVEE